MDTAEIIEELLEEKAYLIDLFPERVPYDPDGRYFAVAEYFERSREDICRRFTNILLKLFCFYHFSITWDDVLTEDVTADQLISMLEKFFSSPTGFLNILLPGYDTLITADAGDQYMVCHSRNEDVTSLLAQLTAAEGLFFRKSAD